MIVETVKRLSSLGEVIAGSKEEEKLVRLVKEVLEEGSDDVRVIPTEVLSWKEKAVSVDCDARAVALAYSPSGRGNAKIVEVRSLFDIPKEYMKAVDSGEEAVAFTLNDGTLRRFVIKYGELLQYTGKPPPIPAVFLSKRPEKEECEIQVETEFGVSYGYNVEAVRNGKGDEIVYVTAHHDHFLRGEHDDLAGVAMLKEIVATKRTIKLVSLTAEETGCFFDALSWGCGARQFVRSIKEKPLFVIDLDFPTKDSRLFVSPGLFKSVSKIVGDTLIVERRPQAYTNSYAFLRAGIPTITLSPAEEMPFYHSDLDSVKPEEDGVFRLQAEMVVKIANEAVVSENETLEDVTTVIDALPLELRLNLAMGLSLEKYLSTFRMVMTSGRARDRPFGEVIGLTASFFDNVTIEGLGHFSVPGDEKERMARSKFLANVVHTLVETIERRDNY
ncbi:MAG: M28 family peptidase [Thermoprotei archaeon]